MTNPFIAAALTLTGTAALNLRQVLFKAAGPAWNRLAPLWLTVKPFFCFSLGACFAKSVF